MGSGVKALSIICARKLHPYIQVTYCRVPIVKNGISVIKQCLMLSPLATIMLSNFSCSTAFKSKVFPMSKVHFTVKSRYANYYDFAGQIHLKMPCYFTNYKMNLSYATNYLPKSEVHGISYIPLTVSRKQ